MLPVAQVDSVPGRGGLPGCYPRSFHWSPQLLDSRGLSSSRELSTACARVSFILLIGLRVYGLGMSPVPIQWLLSCRGRGLHLDCPRVRWPF